MKALAFSLLATLVLMVGCADPPHLAASPPLTATSQHCDSP